MWYQSLPPISKGYGTLCLLVTTASQLSVLNPYYIALLYGRVFKNFEVWRLFTNFFFLGFSINFGIRLLMIARYGVQLEQGPFQRRTADFLWMMIFGAFSLLGNKIQAFIKTAFIAKFKDVLTQGEAYKISNFSVGKNVGDYKPTMHLIVLDIFLEYYQLINLLEMVTHKK
ncbi:derlin-1 isoform X2 [Spinacia oleracea]|uniref:Derlin n=1 Tax=Spinacia oleracea TaxID=3562 RepID=A0ABM3RBD3_SPIOL|nr:derlin-1-like isoform X2 [Spinacia oleracea]